MATSAADRAVEQGPREAVSRERAADPIIYAVVRWSYAQDDDLTVVICDFLG